MPPHIQSQSHKEFVRIWAKVYARARVRTRTRIKITHTPTEKARDRERRKIHKQSRMRHEWSDIFVGFVPTYIYSTTQNIQPEPHYKLKHHHQNVH